MGIGTGGAVNQWQLIREKTVQCTSAELHGRVQDDKSKNVILKEVAAIESAHMPCLGLSIL